MGKSRANFISGLFSAVGIECNSHRVYLSEGMYIYGYLEQMFHVKQKYP
ncbi:MAG: hypothetical protein LBI70_02740 [Rickettsiales bacterium]|jgi:hypothetical protein|nr:hypothetical protein [Rickettsiales bacterium]